MLNTYAAWPGLAQVYRLQREFQWWRKGKCYRISSAVEFGITSLTRTKASPERLLTTDLPIVHYNTRKSLE